MHRQHNSRSLGGLALAVFCFPSLCIAQALVDASSPAASAPPATHITLVKRTSGTYSLNATIPQLGSIDFLFDTGSSHSVIGQSMLQTLIQTTEVPYVRDLRGVLADGSVRILPIHRIAALRLGDNCWIRDVEVAVFPGDTRPILGMSSLVELAPMGLSMDPPLLSVSGCKAGAETVAPPSGGPARGITAR